MSLRDKQRQAMAEARKYEDWYNLKNADGSVKDWGAASTIVSNFVSIALNEDEDDIDRIREELAEKNQAALMRKLEDGLDSDEERQG